MGETAFRGSFEGPDDADEDLVTERTGNHVEFISEIGQVLDLPDVDADGYVGPDGHMQPHQSPAEVAAEKDEDLSFEGRLHEKTSQNAMDAPDLFDEEP